MKKNITRRDFLRLSALTAGAATLTSCEKWLVSAGLKEERPNFLIIYTDDQRYDSMWQMPRTQELIFDQGVTFNHGYITTPLCGPSRCSILTGMYAHSHNIRENQDEGFNETTFAKYLQDDGYYTGMVGKYLNEWTVKDKPKPEFEYWRAISRGQSRYNNPDIMVDGEWVRHQGQYITDVFGDYVIEFIEKAERKQKPFCLYFAPNAPHAPATPADEDKFLSIDLPEFPPNFNEEDVSDKPNWIQEKEPLLSDEAIHEINEFRNDQLLTLRSLDRNIERIINKLKEEELLDKTVIIFLSDNGKLWGEHRMASKNSFYEEASRVPFALRFPPLVPTPYVEEKPVSNIDIAPTLYDLARIPIPPEVEGESLVPLLQTGDSLRDGVLIEGWPGRGHYAAYHVGNYVYAETEGDKSEFYDLEKDPYQLSNGIDQPEYQPIIEKLKNSLDQVREK
ncbi:MAG: sulfatase-like hydrolase/transferase [Anaerolineales bacterium]|nr:sulfatase-like hydrolase/transferase [Anaerolineales bacterium]